VLRRLLLLLAVATLLALPATSYANFWEIYGFNPRAIGMAGCHTAVTKDFTAVHYNPAALTNAEGVTFGFAYNTTVPQLQVDLDKRDAGLEPLTPPSASAVSFGTSFSLGGEALKNRIAMGLGISVPTRSLLNGQALDPAIPHWYMYHSLPERIMANLGIGAKPFDWLSLGIAVQFLAGLSGELDYELDIVSGRFSRKTVLFDIHPKVAPLVGLELRPLDNLRIGASYRKSLSSDIDLPVKLVVTGLADLRVDTNFIVQFMPDQYTLGLSYVFKDWGLLVASDLTWSRWSDAPGPAVNSRVDVSGELFEGTGLGDVLDAPAPGQARIVDLGFEDTFTPRIAVEKNWKLFVLRAGYSVRPSPAPLQTGSTNYIDGTAHHMALGLGFKWQDPFEAFASPIVADLGLQLLHHPTRRHQKFDSTDEVGSYDASGLIWVVGFSLSYIFEEQVPTASTPKVASLGAITK